MQVVFRCDAGSTAGLGHVMRCLALAQAAREGGVQGWFILPECPAGVRRRLESEGFGVLESGLAGGSAGDAARVGRMAIEHDAVAIVIDTALAGRPWMDILRAEVGPDRVRLRMDDSAEPRPLADEWITSPIDDGIVGPAAEDPARPRLLGPDHALLRREHLRRRPVAPSPGGLPRILLTMGGFDPARRTLTVLEGLAPLGRRADLTVLVGGGDPQAGAVQAACDRAGVRCLRDVTDMAGLLAASDIVCTAAGSTTWEACFHRCSLVVAAVADHQRPVARIMSQRARAILVPEADAGDPAAWTAAVVDLLDDPDARMARARTAARLVDGYGADRVVMHLLGEPIRLRDVGPADAAITSGWTGETDEQHERGMAAALADPGTMLLMAHDVRERPVMLIRARRDEPSIDAAADRPASPWTIDLAAAPDATDPGLVAAVHRVVHHRLEAMTGVGLAPAPAPDLVAGGSMRLRWTEPPDEAGETG